MAVTPIIFFGNERLASGITTTAPLLTFFIESSLYDVKAVVLSQSRQSGRSRAKSEVEQLAEEKNITIIKPEKVSDINDYVTSNKVPLGILAAFGRIVPQSTIDSFKYGIVNLHPSLLPEYRGSTPIESAILNGNETTGMSLMQLVRKMDAGPIIGFSELKLNHSETKQDLYDSLSVLGVALLDSLLPELLSDSLTPLHQDESAASYTERLDKTVSQVDLNKSATQLEREVRAFAGWPKSRTTINQKDIVITQASIMPRDGKIIGEVFAHEGKPALQTKKTLWLLSV